MLRPFSDVKIFIISLPRENKRRTAMQEKLQGISDDFEFFDAIDGAKEKLSQHQDYVGLKRRLFYGKDLSDGELGCFFSHRALINKIVQDNIPFAVILEDDAILLKDFQPTVEALLNSTYPWDFVRFLTKPKIKRKTQSEVASLFKDYKLLRIATAPGGAYAYIVSHKGAKKLQHAMKSIWCPNDTLMGQPLRTCAEILTIYPPIADWDKSFYSAIGDERFKKNVLSGWEKLIYPITRGVFKIIDGLIRKSFYLAIVAKKYIRDGS